MCYKCVEMCGLALRADGMTHPQSALRAHARGLPLLPVMRARARPRRKKKSAHETASGVPGGARETSGQPAGRGASSGDAAGMTGWGRGGDGGWSGRHGGGLASWGRGPAASVPLEKAVQGVCLCVCVCVCVCVCIPILYACTHRHTHTHIACIIVRTLTPHGCSRRR